MSNTSQGWSSVGIKEAQAHAKICEALFRQIRPSKQIQDTFFEILFYYFSLLAFVT